MTDSVFSVDTMINLVQKLRQEKAECKEAISQTRHKARVLGRRVEEVARQVGMTTTVMVKKVPMMTALNGRVEARLKMFNQVKQRGDMTLATAKDCIERLEEEAKERFNVVEEFKFVCPCKQVVQPFLLFTDDKAMNNNNNHSMVTWCHVLHICLQIMCQVIKCPLD